MRWNFIIIIIITRIITIIIIKILQIDIEEYEFSEGGFDDWIRSGALENVNQMALELHVVHQESNPR